MKRIIAKEFLLLITCFVLVLLVALFGWLRNTWFEHDLASAGREHALKAKALDSLSQRAVPIRLDFLDLFEPEFVRGNCGVFLTSPSWTSDPFLAGLPMGSLSEQYVEYRQRVYNGLVSDFPGFKSTKAEFNERIDNDPAYAERVYGIIASIVKDLKRPKEEFLVLLNAAQSPDPSSKFGGQQDVTWLGPQFNRRYLMCIVIESARFHFYAA